MNESKKLKRLREKDSEAASEQLSRITRASVTNLFVPRAIHTYNMAETLRENFNSLLTRIANIETRLLALEDKVSAIIKENKTWHR
ncbi:MAG: hypothetical protein GF375_05025 [Candidatus Omnitrophica bacterium]|nr:hypothetical protein [Candidatus Omnitrophota bacterium]